MTVFKLTLLGLCGLFWLSFAQARAADKERGFLDRVFSGAKGDKSKYVLFVPHDYQDDKAFPLILFLHGAGETGTDGMKQAQVGLGPAIEKRQKTFGFIAVLPQSQQRTWQADTEDSQRALAILAQVQKTYNVDSKRIYLTGISMGGYGTWSLAAKYSERWAAIAPICGGGDPKDAARIKGIPCWCFHGDADEAVPVQESREMIEALKKAGGKPKYDEYANVGHNSWDRAYGNEELYRWFLQQKLP